MRYFISDQHFYHSNIINIDGRLFSSVLEMNEYMIEKWNSRVKVNDEVSGSKTAVPSPRISVGFLKSFTSILFTMSRSVAKSKNPVKKQNKMAGSFFINRYLFIYFTIEF